MLPFEIVEVKQASRTQRLELVVIFVVGTQTKLDGLQQGIKARRIVRPNVISLL